MKKHNHNWFTRNVLYWVVRGTDGLLSVILFPSWLFDWILAKLDMPKTQRQFWVGILSLPLLPALIARNFLRMTFGKGGVA